MEVYAIDHLSNLFVAVVVSARIRDVHCYLIKVSVARPILGVVTNIGLSK